MKKGNRKKNIEFWLSRDKRELSSYILWSSKPRLCGNYYDGKLIKSFCQREWSKLMPSLRLRPGQFRQVIICEVELENMSGMFIGFAKDKK